MVNEARGGSYLTNDIDPEDELMDIRGQFIEGSWDWLVMDGGGNDLNDECGCGECIATIDDIISEDGAEGALSDFINARTDEGIKVIYMGYYDVPDSAEFGFDRCRNLLPQLMARVELLAEANDLLWFVDAGDVVDSANLDYFLDDRVHPSPLGSRVIGYQIAEQIAAIEALE